MGWFNLNTPTAVWNSFRSLFFLRALPECDSETRAEKSVKDEIGKTGLDVERLFSRLFCFPRLSYWSRKISADSTQLLSNDEEETEMRLKISPLHACIFFKKKGSAKLGKK